MRLTTGWQSVCGGSLVSNTRVLTAAHCWWDGQSQANLFTIGSYWNYLNLLTPNLNQVANIVKIYALSHCSLGVTYSWFKSIPPLMWHSVFFLRLLTIAFTVTLMSQTGTVFKLPNLQVCVTCKRCSCYFSCDFTNLW